MSAATVSPKLNVSALRDPSRAVSRIADALIPYLEVLVREFAPHEVILFGSYAYGAPTPHSDVDLLVIKDLTDSPVHEASRIRAAWRPLRKSGPNLGFDLLVDSPEGHQERLERNS